MAVMISLRLPEEQAAALDRAVAEGRYPNRTQAVRALVADFAADERRRALAERFRRAYAGPPSPDEQDLGALLHEAARRQPEP